jgi:DNA ligase-1
MQENFTGWLMSEKLDGVRAIWTGSELISRQGRPFAAPSWFLAALPEGIALEGELWMGRGEFQSVITAIVRQSPLDAEWRRMTFNVFDAPAASGDFPTRIAYAASVLPACPFTRIIPQLPCLGPVDLAEFYNGILAANGEGVMLRHPSTGEIVKRKPLETDEGTLIHLGFTMELLWNGRKLKVGINNDAHTHPPTPGQPITFAYSGLTTTGLPRNPRFVATRNYE